MPYSFYFLLLGSYLVGSFSPSITISTLVLKRDIRSLGSGNAGATNAFRFLGKKWGLGILALDIIKGIIPILALSLVNINSSFFSTLDQKNIVGLCVMLGHIFPIFFKFKGGKGVATLFGVVLATSAMFSAMVLLFFLLIVLFIHYVSLGSILSTLFFSAWLLYQKQDYLSVWNILLCCSFSIIVLWSHRQNVSRVFKGKENKMFLFKKK